MTLSNQETNSNEPQNCGSSAVFASYNGNETPGDLQDTYILSYVDLFASDAIVVGKPVLKTDSDNKYYLHCEITYPNTAGENLVSYPVPVFKYTKAESAYPEYIEFQTNKKGSKVKVKINKPVGQGIKAQQVAENEISTNIWTNKPVQPAGVSESPTFYFLFTQITNAGGQREQLKRTDDLETNTLYYSFVAATSSDSAAKGVSSDFLSDNQMIFTTITLMQESTVLSSSDLGGAEAPMSGFQANSADA